MRGIEYIVDDRGQKRAAVIDFDVYGSLWEDIHDILVVESRKREPRVKWENAKKRLHEEKE
ncbi:MAG: hypothetical protein LRZ87_00095 [Methanocellales archaeon]|nr:hypothetical protein [Methanocellales archaeon]